LAALLISAEASPSFRRASATAAFNSSVRVTSQRRKSGAWRTDPANDFARACPASS
jgi:hypothetical protein